MVGPILGRQVTWAPEGSIEAAVRNTIFQRYNEISATLSGGPRRYAPVFMRTDDGEVLLEDFANGFYFGMRVSIDDWKPFISDPEISMAMVAILGQCTTMISEDEQMAVMDPLATQLLAEVRIARRPGNYRNAALDPGRIAEHDDPLTLKPALSLLPKLLERPRRGKRLHDSFTAQHVHVRRSHR